MELSRELIRTSRAQTILNETRSQRHQRERRRWMQRVSAAALALYAPGAFAESLAVTPRLTEGPFYPDKLPLDTDNDLLIVNDSITPAVGTITHLSGKVLSRAGIPIRNAIVEIWQVDGNGVYLHSADPRRQKRDGNFQGYGRFLTDSKGTYYFRTIKPVPYPGRTPHIHVAVSQNGERVLTTQLLIKGEAQNERDMVFRGLRDPKERELLLVAFEPARPASRELAAQFDIVLGRTPAEPDESADSPVRGGIGKNDRLARRRRPSDTRKSDAR